MTRFLQDVALAVVTLGFAAWVAVAVELMR
jgi:hypothetical protein